MKEILIELSELLDSYMRAHNEGGLVSFDLGEFIHSLSLSQAQRLLPYMTAQSGLVIVATAGPDDETIYEVAEDLAQRIVGFKEGMVITPGLVKDLEEVVRYLTDLDEMASAAELN